MNKNDIINVVENIEKYKFEDKKYKKINFINGLCIFFNDKNQIEHPEDKPAMITKNSKFFFSKNLLHRENCKYSYFMNDQKYFFYKGNKISKKKVKKMRKQKIIINKIKNF